jgi:actin related protein 2/3 complex, subunit 1A/1B
MTSLPYVSLIWTAEDSLVAAGHDCQPIVFSGSEAGWQVIGSLDDTTAPKSSGGASKFGVAGVGRLNSAAFNTFRNADSRGQSSPVSGQTSTGTELTTVHQNTITNVRPYQSQGGSVTKISTSGVDGKLVIWNVSNVSGGGGLVPRLSGMNIK